MSSEIPNTNTGETEEQKAQADLEASLAWSMIVYHPFIPSPEEQQADAQD